MASVSPRESARPSPMPVVLSVSPSRWNGTNTSSRWPSGIPGPRSTTRSSTASAQPARGDERALVGGREPQGVGEQVGHARARAGRDRRRPPAGRRGPRRAPAPSRGRGRPAPAPRPRRPRWAGGASRARPPGAGSCPAGCRPARPAGPATRPRRPAGRVGPGGRGRTSLLQQAGDRCLGRGQRRPQVVPDGRQQRRTHPVGGLELSSARRRLPRGAGSGRGARRPACRTHRPGGGPRPRGGRPRMARTRPLAGRDRRSPPRPGGAQGTPVAARTRQRSPSCCDQGHRVQREGLAQPLQHLAERVALGEHRGRQVGQRARLGGRARRLACTTGSEVDDRGDEHRDDDEHEQGEGVVGVR